MRGTIWSGAAQGVLMSVVLGLSACLFAGHARANADCAALKPVMPLPANALQLNPIAEELASPNAQLGSGVGFAGLFPDGTSVELVTARIKRSECRAMAATAAPISTSGAYQPASNDPKAWRFDMTQNGKRMTADEFDAWMKARGVRVIPGPVKAEAAAPPPPAPAPPPKKKKR